MTPPTIILRRELNLCCEKVKLVFSEFISDTRIYNLLYSYDYIYKELDSKTDRSYNNRL